MRDLRPSFDERDSYVSLLTTAYVDGRIDELELERRTQAVLSAVTHSDAIAQFDGLPEPNVMPAPVKAPRPQPKAAPVAPVGTGAPGGSKHAGRRAFILGGTVLGGIALLAAASGVFDQYPGAEASAIPESPTEPLDIAQSQLWARELTSIAELRVTPTLVRGTASNPRAPQDWYDFEVAADGGFAVTPSSVKNVERTVPVDEAFPLASMAFYGGPVAEGTVTSVEIVFTADGRPAAKVTIVNGAQTKIAVIDQDGNLISLEDA